MVEFQLPGIFITVEGGEGAGKSTLLEGLYNHFESEGLPVIRTRAPGGTEVGQKIRTLLLSHKESSLSPKCELLLFMADRAQHVEEVIKPALTKGMIVLCDRFNDSTVAYQGAARGFGAEEVMKLCHYATGGISPDLTLYLDLSPEKGLERRIKASQVADRIESEALLFHEKIREGFLMISSQEPDRFRIIDASKPADQVLKEAIEIVRYVCETPGK